MLNITKNEAFYLREIGFSDKVKQSKSRNPHYYVVEDYRYKFDNNENVISSTPVMALKALYDYRNNIASK